MTTPHARPNTLLRDWVMYRATVPGEDGLCATVDQVAAVHGVSRRTVQLAIQAGKSGQLRERAAQLCAPGISSGTGKDAFQRDRRRRNRAPGSSQDY